MRLESQEPKGAVEEERPRQAGLAACFGLVGAFWFVLLVATPFVARPGAGSWGRQSLVVLGLAALGAVLWEWRKGMFRIVTSVPFSVALLTAILAATILGTLVLQQAPAAEYELRYGTALTPFLLWIGLDDLFHALWFKGLLALLAVVLVLVAVKNRAWRPPLWGHLLSHIGVVVVLVGGLLGSRFGFKGFIDFRVGEGIQEARGLARGIPTAERHPLGFTLRLEDFQVEHHDPKWRLCVHPDGGEFVAPTRSATLEEAKAGLPLSVEGSQGGSFRLIHVYPDFQLRSEVKKAPEGKGRPALRVSLRVGGSVQETHLWAGVPGRDVLRFPDGGGGGGEMRFVWTEPGEAEIARRASAELEVHAISIEATPGLPLEEVRVAPGGTYGLASGQYELRVLAYLPDFVYDVENRKPATRSQEPNNPALQVAVKEVGSGAEETRWLFARMPDYGRQHGREASGGPHWVYRYSPSRGVLARELLIVGKDREVWEFVQGQLAARTPLSAGLPAMPGSIGGLEVIDSAEEEHIPGTRSEAWENPVAEVELTRGNETAKLFLSAVHGNPVRLWEGGPFLSFEGQRDDPKAFRSRLAVIEDGTKVLEKTIVVNDPLTYKGYSFYQANFKKEDPTYSGLQVVKDPGLAVVYAGLVMISLGVIFAFYVRPVILRRGADGS